MQQAFCEQCGAKVLVADNNTANRILCKPCATKSTAAIPDRRYPQLERRLGLINDGLMVGAILVALLGASATIVGIGLMIYAESQAAGVQSLILGIGTLAGSGIAYVVGTALVQLATVVLDCERHLRTIATRNG
jgi:hypothetical protein